MHQTTYDQLKRIARAEDYATYSHIAPLAGLDMDNQADRNRIADILDEISRHEHNEGHPLLSAVVVRADENKPGQGFFTLARDLGVYAGNDDLKFWLDELKRVRKYWSVSGSS